MVHTTDRLFDVINYEIWLYGEDTWFEYFWQEVDKYDTDLEDEAR